MGALEDVRWCSEQVDAMQKRIAGLEKQLAEERSNRAGVERLRASHYELERMLAEQTKRAEAAEEQSRLRRNVIAEDDTAFVDMRERAEAAEKRISDLQPMLETAKATQLQLEARIAELQAQPAPKVRIVDPCGKRLECGGKCHLAMAHHGYCLCVGDTDGPGTCDA